MMNRTNKKRNIFNSFSIYYRYYRSTGLYSFIFKNLLKTVAIIVVVGIAALMVNKFIIKITDIPDFLIQNFNTTIVLLFFYLSESFLGLIPPDIFILWVTEFQHFYFWVSILGIISYFGGLTAYYIGGLIRLTRHFRTRIEHFYQNNISKIEHWGGIFIIIAALFPLPYAVVTLLCGLLKFPLKKLIYLGCFRILRFYIYAALITILV